jgi:hypothetical protein
MRWVPVASALKEAPRVPEALRERVEGNQFTRLVLTSTP